MKSKSLKIAITNRTNIKENYTYSRANVNYINAVLKSEALPIILPNAPYEVLKEIMEDMDGLIITGGDDIYPSLYNEENTHCLLNTIDDDYNDLNLIKIALELNKPILGICRGLQIINVYFKGSLYQDILKQNHTSLNHNQREVTEDTVYYANFIKGSIMHQIYGERYKINSFHHQAIKDVGKDLIITGYGDDKVIEAFELDEKILGVQWHPEQLTDDEKHLNLFKKFNEICLKNKSR